jgi:hypothetical protein
VIIGVASKDQLSQNVFPLLKRLIESKSDTSKCCAIALFPALYQRPSFKTNETMYAHDELTR